MPRKHFEGAIMDTVPPSGEPSTLPQRCSAIRGRSSCSRETMSSNRRYFRGLVAGSEEVIAVPHPL